MHAIEIAKTYIQAAQTGDQATLARVLSPDVVWHQPGNNQFSGTHRGMAAAYAAVTFCIVAVAHRSHWHPLPHRPVRPEI